jgi:hypothetical protein
MWLKNAGYKVENINGDLINFSNMIGYKESELEAMDFALITIATHDYKNMPKGQWVDGGNPPKPIESFTWGGNTNSFYTSFCIDPATVNKDTPFLQYQVNDPTGIDSFSMPHISLTSGDLGDRRPENPSNEAYPDSSLIQYLVEKYVVNHNLMSTNDNQYIYHDGVQNDDYTAGRLEVVLDAIHSSILNTDLAVGRTINNQFSMTVGDLVTLNSDTAIPTAMEGDDIRLWASLDSTSSIDKECIANYQLKNVPQEAKLIKVGFTGKSITLIKQEDGSWKYKGSGDFDLLDGDGNSIFGSDNIVLIDPTESSLIIQPKKDISTDSGSKTAIQIDIRIDNDSSVDVHGLELLAKIRDEGDDSTYMTSTQPINISVTPLLEVKVDAAADYYMPTEIITTEADEFIDISSMFEFSSYFEGWGYDRNHGDIDYDDINFATIAIPKKGLDPYYNPYYDFGYQEYGLPAGCSLVDGNGNPLPKFTLKEGDDDPWSYSDPWDYSDSNDDSEYDIYILDPSEFASGKFLQIKYDGEANLAYMPTFKMTIGNIDDEQMETYIDSGGPQYYDLLMENYLENYLGYDALVGFAGGGADDPNYSLSRAHAEVSISVDSAQSTTMVTYVKLAEANLELSQSNEQTISLPENAPVCLEAQLSNNSAIDQESVRGYAIHNLPKCGATLKLEFEAVTVELAVDMDSGTYTMISSEPAFTNSKALLKFKIEDGSTLSIDKGPYYNGDFSDLKVEMQFDSSVSLDINDLSIETTIYDKSSRDYYTLSSGDLDVLRMPKMFAEVSLQGVEPITIADGINIVDLSAFITLATNDYAGVDFAVVTIEGQLQPGLTLLDGNDATLKSFTFADSSGTLHTSFLLDSAQLESGNFLQVGYTGDGSQNSYTLPNMQIAIGDIDDQLLVADFDLETFLTNDVGEALIGGPLSENMNSQVSLVTSDSSNVEISFGVDITTTMVNIITPPTTEGQMALIALTFNHADSNEVIGDIEISGIDANATLFYMKDNALYEIPAADGTAIVSEEQAATLSIQGSPENSQDMHLTFSAIVSEMGESKELSQNVTVELTPHAALNNFDLDLSGHHLTEDITLTQDIDLSASLDFSALSGVEEFVIFKLDSNLPEGVTLVDQVGNSLVSATDTSGNVWYTTTEELGMKISIASQTTISETTISFTSGIVDIDEDEYTGDLSVATLADKLNFYTSSFEASYAEATASGSVTIKIDPEKNTAWSFGTITKMTEGVTEIALPITYTRPDLEEILTEVIFTIDNLPQGATLSSDSQSLIISENSSGNVFTLNAGGDDISSLLSSLKITSLSPDWSGVLDITAAPTLMQGDIPLNLELISTTAVVSENMETTFTTRPDITKKEDGPYPSVNISLDMRSTDLDEVPIEVVIGAVPEGSEVFYKVGYARVYLEVFDDGTVIIDESTNSNHSVEFITSNLMLKLPADLNSDVRLSYDVMVAEDYGVGAVHILDPQIMDITLKAMSGRADKDKIQVVLDKDASDRYMNVSSILDYDNMDASDDFIIVTFKNSTLPDGVEFVSSESGDPLSVVGSFSNTKGVEFTSIALEPGDDLYLKIPDSYDGKIKPKMSSGPVDLDADTHSSMPIDVNTVSLQEKLDYYLSIKSDRDITNHNYFSESNVKNEITFNIEKGRDSEVIYNAMVSETGEVQVAFHVNKPDVDEKLGKILFEKLSDDAEVWHDGVLQQPNKMGIYKFDQADIEDVTIVQSADVDEPISFKMRMDVREGSVRLDKFHESVQIDVATLRNEAQAEQDAIGLSESDADLFGIESASTGMESISSVLNESGAATSEATASESSDSPMVDEELLTVEGSMIDGEAVEPVDTLLAENPDSSQPSLDDETSSSSDDQSPDELG